MLQIPLLSYMSIVKQHRIYYRAVFTWLLFIPVVFLNGTIREVVYKQYMGDLAAHQVSTMFASASFITVAYYHLRHHLRSVGSRSLFTIGLMWLVMTVLFEFGLGFFVGSSWDKLIYDYNILEGRIWILFLVTLLATPYIIKKWKPSNTNKFQRASYGRVPSGSN